jgi:hypothetical protein
MAVMDRLAAIDSELDEGQKLRGGAVLLVTGGLLVGLLAFTNIGSVPLQVLIGIVGVICMAGGSLAVGTSGVTDRAV